VTPGRRPAATAGATLLTVLTLAALGPAGCVRHPARPTPAAAAAMDPRTTWVRTLPDAQRAAADGRYDEADRLLAGFAQLFPRSQQAGEVHYWRALFKLDPANKDATPQQAVASLDAYLALGDAQPHRSEALVLRRTAAHMRILADSAAPRPSTAERDKAREEEMQKLRDDLAKAQEELERIRKRLASPKP